MSYNILKALFLLLALFTNVLGFDISNTNKYENLNKQIKIFYDNNEEYNIQTVLSKEFTTPDSMALGYVEGAVWSKLELVNLYKKQRTLFVNPKININSIDVYVFENDILKSTHQLGNYRSVAQNHINSKFSNFSIDMEANTKYTIITKIKSKSPIDATWMASSDDEFLSFIMYDILFWGVFLGFVLSLVIYNISVFKSLKDMSYIAYALHGLTALLFQFSTNGIFYQFEFYSNLIIFNSVSWVIAQLSIVSILLFAMLFFNTKKTMPIIHKVIKLLFFVVFGMTLLFAYSFFDVEIINTVRTVTKFISLIIVLFVFMIAIIGLKNKTQGALFYFIGHGIFLSAILYQQFGGIINSETSLFTIYIVAIGILFDVVFLSLALGEKLTALKYEKEKNEKLLISQSSFSAIGRTIGNLSHQWKIPVARLGSLITQIEAILWKRNDSLKDELDDVLVSMRSSLDFMQNSISEFNNFYIHSSQKINFNLANEINNIVDLLSAKIMYTDCTIVKELDDSIELFGYKSAFANVCLVIIDNSLDIFKQRQIQNAVIEIKLTMEGNSIILTFKDNGGGITIQPIERIFDVFVSDKADGNGMGLAMVQVLVKERLNGNISVHNENNGAVFEVEIKVE